MKFRFNKKKLGPFEKPSNITIGVYNKLEVSSSDKVYSIYQNGNAIHLGNREEVLKFINNLQSRLC